MRQTQSEKKIFAITVNNTVSIECIDNYVDSFSNYFRTYRFNNTPTARYYVQGLLLCNKGQANMERMEEEVEGSEYRAYQHFITNSNWDTEGLRTALSKEASKVLSKQKQLTGRPTGYIVDESGHLKKGKQSVGVARQYAGVAGKVDNCQVGVYCSLVNGCDATIINERIFLPENWTTDPVRCKAAGIPTEYQKFKTKPQLVLDMIKQDIENGVEFDWIGGDGLYGHSYELCKGIDQLGKLFVLDVHKDETVYLQEPVISVPERKSKKGKTPFKLTADKAAVRLDALLDGILTNEWIRVNVRDSTSGILQRDVYKRQVWVWDKEESQARKRTLIITKTVADKPEIKYSLSNGDVNQYTHKEYAYFVCQRYWVERTFDDAKNEIGLSDYQIRKWRSWHNHHAMVMLTALFIMKQKIENREQTPLLSFRDTRILIILHLFGTNEQIEKRLEQMAKRHDKRNLSILFNYKKQAEYKELLTL